MKDDTKAIQGQHDKHLEERDEILDDISRYQEKLTSKNRDLDKLAGEINEIETNISKIGGGFASQRTELQAKRAFLEMKIASIENDLRVLISGPLPFCIIPKHIQSLKSQIKKDSKILKNQIEKEILSEKINEISKSLNSKKLWNGVNIDSETREKLVKNISLLLSPDVKTENITSMFNLSTLESSNIISLIDNLKTEHLDKLNKKSQEFHESSDELQRVDVALVNAPNDDEIGPLISEVNALHENQGILKNEIKHLEKQVTTKQSYLKMINVKLRNILSDKYKDKNAGIQAELATRVQKVLDEYIEKLKIKKLQLLEEYLLEEVKRLMHKDNLITKVSVNKETFEIILYDKDENPFPKDLLSKGEKQMYATAVLLALAKTSGKPLPFMIDTPLARLDIGHRDNLIKKFFPYASHQVVIFSTDSEIDEKYYPKLKPYLSRSYAMEYLPGEGKTRQHLGYFWNDAGVKIIAV
ncbi:MAG: DNA sulfur modification protein DndD [Thaumarchaeota archaeon]|nr:MAG: DNA sulfur modification protein DndD [Nitrososphaerota archaeon]